MEITCSHTSILDQICHQQVLHGLDHSPTPGNTQIPGGTSLVCRGYWSGTPSAGSSVNEEYSDVELDASEQSSSGGEVRGAIVAAPMEQAVYTEL